MEFVVRRFEESDNVSELTALVRSAYAQLAEMGFRFLATWQDDAITLERISRGECFVATIGERLIGTLTVSPPTGESKTEWYARPDVASFGQFGVLPEFQGLGVGRRLLEVAEARAREFGAAELACDTAEGATHLIDMYKRFGFRIVGMTDWALTNYKSAILSKTL